MGINAFAWAFARDPEQCLKVWFGMSTADLRRFMDGYHQVGVAFTTPMPKLMIGRRPVQAPCEAAWLTEEGWTDRSTRSTTINYAAVPKEE